MREGIGYLVFGAFPLNITPFLYRKAIVPTTATIMSAMSIKNPTVVHIDGGKSVRVIVTEPDEVTETKGLVAVAVTAVSQYVVV